MGRGTQLFDFLASEKMPTKLEIEHRYTGLSITDELKRFRRQWRKENKGALEGDMIDVGVVFITDTKFGGE